MPADRKPRPEGEDHRPETTPGFDEAAAYGAHPSYLPSGHRPAGLGPRAAARIVDGLIVGLPAGYVYYSLGSALGTLGVMLGAVLFGLAFSLYSTIMEARDGQTVGKRLLKLRVLAPSSAQIAAPPTLSQAFRRNWFTLILILAALPIFMLALIGAVAYLATVVSIAVGITKDPYHQGSHDAVADGTQVVRL